MKKLSILLIILLLLIAMVGCSSESEEKNILRVGMELKYPPFETIDVDGNPEGVSVKMAEALGKHLGMKVEIVDTAYPSLIPALESGNIDIIISSMTINEKRLEVVDFSDPYTTSQLMLLAYKDSKVKSYKDLNDSDVIISCKTGTIGALWAAVNAPDAQIKNIDEEASAVLEVAQGNADVFIYDPLSIVKHQKNFPEATVAILEPLPNTQGWGIALRKGEDDLKEKINAWLKDAKTDGTFDTIREDYLKDKVKEFEENGLEFFF